MVQAAKGLHKSALCRRIGKGWGTVSHHVNILRDEGAIFTETHGRKLWIFAPGLAHADREWIVATTPMERSKLLSLLGLKPKATVSTLSQQTLLSRKVIRTHMSHLTRVGAVDESEDYPPKYELKKRQPSIISQPTDKRH